MIQVLMLKNYGVQADGSPWLLAGNVYVVPSALGNMLWMQKKAKPDFTNLSEIMDSKSGNFKWDGDYAARYERAVAPKPETREETN